MQCIQLQCHMARITPAKPNVCQIRCAVVALGFGRPHGPCLFDNHISLLPHMMLTSARPHVRPSHSMNCKATAGPHSFKRSATSLRARPPDHSGACFEKAEAEDVCKATTRRSALLLGSSMALLGGWTSVPDAALADDFVTLPSGIKVLDIRCVAHPQARTLHLLHVRCMVHGACGHRVICY